MAKVNDGGPAFPQLKKGYASIDQGATTDIVEDVTGGMTLRDYFVAHAPQEPCRGFRPIMRPKPETVWQDPKEPHDDFCNTIKNQDELDAWEREYIKQTWIQWPYAWADAMIAERERSQSKTIDVAEITPPANNSGAEI